MATGYDPHTLLQRVLLLERQQGFKDRSATGGLSRFARTQIERAGNGGTPNLTGAANLLEGYESLDRHGRERAVTSALEVLLRGPGTPTAPSGEPGPRGVSPPRNARPPHPPVPAAPRPRPVLTIVHRPEELDGPIENIKGLRRPVADALAKLGVSTIRDLITYFPRTHYDYTDTRSISRMRVGVPMTLVGTVTDVRTNHPMNRGARSGRDISVTRVVISDETGTVAVRWFNQPYLAKTFRPGTRVAITGEPEVRDGYIAFSPRDYEIIETDDLTHAARLVPIYPLTKGLYQRSFRALMRRVVDEYASAVEDPLPPDIGERLALTPLHEAIHSYHFPDSEEAKHAAQQRLAFDELLLVHLGLLIRKSIWQEVHPDVAIPRDDDLLDVFRDSLPFPLTGAQQRVIDTILNDMARSVPMSRLVQGDVGSGKTVVAAAALLETVRAGKQTVLMAPTEILAEQHFKTLKNLLEPFGVRLALAIGSVSKAKRRPIYEGISAGEIDLVAGTHALIQESLEFQNLGLAVTDEQHRFGVEQRAALRAKGLYPHTLAMTATPIPRTLAMTIYGDLDVSSVDEMPPGRVPVITTWAGSPREAYGVIRDEIEHGHQAFVICPVIEESVDTDMRSVIAEHKELQSLVFPDLRVGLLHGRLKPAEKDRILTAFRNGEYEILVATSVVEVGIDIPNATAMVIRDAHRFGLAQLHQFRGRVGRGGDQAFCVLLSDSRGDEARERLEALTATDNGFELAEEDLRLRGPGEFWGTRQSGLPALKVATLGDLKTIELSRLAAEDILSSDPTLDADDHALLRAAVRRFWNDSADLS